ncbi:MAG: hypothetical protein U0936_12460 [Planctomycetaceae bacterium]
MAINRNFGSGITRRHSRQKTGKTPDSKGERFYLHGKRWRLPRNLPPHEVEARISLLRALWDDHERFCRNCFYIDPFAYSPGDEALLQFKAEAYQRQRRIQESAADNHAKASEGDALKWTPLVLWVAEQINHGIKPIPLPPLQTILSSIHQHELVDFRFCHIARLMCGPPGTQPDSTERLRWQDAMKLHDSLSKAYPSIPWVMTPSQIKESVEFHEHLAVQAFDTVARIRSEEAPSPSIQNIAGTFHQAVRVYVKKRTDDFARGDEFDGSGHHMVGLAKDFETRQPDVPLALLDFSRCQEIYDFWRNRPLNLKTGQPLSAKHCSSHIGELNRFFKWLHTTPAFGWRRVGDFEFIEKAVKRLPSDRPSIQDIEIKVFGIDHLKLLYKHALPSERLKIVWCLNCSHGAAEIGRVEWEDLFLYQPHPWAREGLELASDSTDSWCGLLRPKTDVVGWWWLWPETVALVKWWKAELETRLQREVQPSERMLLTRSGQPVYRDSSRNAQTSFANEWSRLLNRVLKAEGKNAIPRLPFGTLRDQMSNWLGSDQNRAVIASVALAHGIPHKEDKLLYKHYSNRPWAHFFEAQKDYRKLLQPIFDDAPNVALTVE